MQNLLELKGISRAVSDRFSLRDVTLAVEPGQIVGFVGANGAGKTTTIRAALGLIKLDAGEVHLFGQCCGADVPGEVQRCLHARIGLVLDTCPFPSTLKVTEVEALVSPAYPTWSHDTFASLIDRFGLDPKAKVKDLSRG
ncbi:MAG: ATP-binding cassette domain-containing protein, partial [Collinsella sp.]|nr:ATP-binding cassette domain-containing protein [Collinsella sp.]